jgi:hypothetical protein
MQNYCRLAMAALVAAAVIVLTGLPRAAADPAGPVIPLPDGDRTQLDRLLGKGVVGEALPSAPLAAIYAYLPPDEGCQLGLVPRAGLGEDFGQMGLEGVDAALNPAQKCPDRSKQRTNFERC